MSRRPRLVESILRCETVILPRRPVAMTEVPTTDLRAYIEALERDAARLRASIGAIHWRVSGKSGDVVAFSVIRQECEEAAPELAAIDAALAEVAGGASTGAGGGETRNADQA